MEEITKIVVPVDLEKHTRKLTKFAIYMAKKLGARVNFVHITEFYASGDMMMGSPTLEKINEERVKNAEVAMENLISDFKGEYGEISGKVIIGEIVDTIVAYADEEEANLVIIGTHGAKGLEKILLGSVAERVVKRVHCPTLTMNPYK